ncbi:RagB/SusD family nutrient uptake outer membrane protein [uncultured Draconibacterium sp.]|uniref:RagB/SusD family nutrient uptake outer membrane protein n=1 Tax=uncultured Draconibacterium sp. TaxID=1573823 RepID=UPI0025E36C96|nr:RagB/SusD family nutrient uptake outer membrane protein [uncultured Draconibacterium sp.]
MKKKNRYVKVFSLTLIFATLILSSCQEDFLDRSPLDQLSEAIYFKTPADFETASNYFYTRFGFEDGDETSDLSNNIGYGTDIVYGNGYTVAPVSDSEWNNNYDRMRAPNQLLEKAAEYEGDQSEIAEYVGIAYFFRAWHHWKLLKRFGGVPIVTKALDVADEELYAPRNSRYEVAAQIVADLDAALATGGLRSQNDIGDGEQGRLSLEAVKAFKARVLLYEATWEKYAPNAYLDAATGDAKPAGYPSINDMLSEAKAEALAVMNSGAFELWDMRDEMKAVEVLETDNYAERHLYYMFTLEDGSNPAGLTKADNKEYILQTVYDYNYRKIGQNISHAKPWGPTRKLMDMYLCADGLPVQHSSVFNGYANMMDEFENRDLRLKGLVYNPFVQYWGYGTSTSVGGGAQYGVAFEDGVSTYNYTYTPALQTETNGRNIGYMGHKFVTEHIGRETTTESFNYPLIRLAEVMLIYAEATCELGGGQISDADLNISINKIRERSGVAPLTNALIAPFSDLTMLGEIRRERSIELFGENFRFDDLKRWGIAVEELKPAMATTYIQYDGVETEYATVDNPKSDGKLYNPDGFSFGLTTSEYSPSTYAGIATTKPGALILVISADRLFSEMNYLDPIPTLQIEHNPALTQNPGW